MEDAYSLDRNGRSTQTDEWLKGRFSLFERFCLPSINSQTCKNFIWFVLFSTDTPEEYKERINNYERSFSYFKPLFLSNGDYGSIIKIFNQEMLNFTHLDDKYIITSRIDNDDAYHKDMILEIQSFFKKQRNMFLNFDYGLQYDVQRKVLVNMHYVNNHFISRFEKISDGVETVITYNHAFINDAGDVHYINNHKKPTWIEIIHDGNVSNNLRASSKPVFHNRYFKSFGINETISYKQTLLIFYKYSKRNIYVHMAHFLRKIGLYDFAKKTYHWLK